MLTLRQLNNMCLDVRLVLNNIERGPYAEIISMKKQMKAALHNMPSLAVKVDSISSLRELYSFGKEAMRRIQTDIRIEKEM